jgi:hypothetical protein
MAADPAATYPLADLVALLAGSISEAVAAAKITQHARALNISTEGFTRTEAQSILERIAQEPGLVGITARFAKARVALQWTK